MHLHERRTGSALLRTALELVRSRLGRQQRRTCSVAATPQGELCYPNYAHALILIFTMERSAYLVAFAAAVRLRDI